MPLKNQGVKTKLTTLSLGAVLAASINQTDGQYAPPPPPQPFPGFINDSLRKKDPYMGVWDFGGNLRVRYEDRWGLGISGVPGSVDFRDHGADVHNNYLLNRLRFRAGYTGEWFSAFAEGRSSTAISDERWAAAGVYEGDGPESDVIDLHQAYVTVGNHREFPVSLKLGRQELLYGEERIIGPFGWNNIGRVFDGAKVRWQTEYFAADFFGVKHVIPEDGKFNEHNEDELFSGIYATTGKVPKHSLEAYFLSRNVGAGAISAATRPQFPQPSARDIYMLGFRLKSKPGAFGPWDYTVEALGQLGNFRDQRLGATSARQDHEAYFYSIQGGYTFVDSFATPRLGLEYTHGSGDSNPTDGKHETFDNLFPTNHKFYGYMDVVGPQNLHNIRGILQGKAHPQVSVALEGHLFWLDETGDNLYNKASVPRGGVGTTPGAGYGINPSYNSFVGSEVDLVVGYALNKFTQLEGGYAHFFVGDYIQSSLSSPAFGARDADFVYLQLSINF